MVSELNKNEKTYFVCDECKLIYADKEKAEQCESWCKKNPGTCDPEVVKYVVTFD